MNTLRVLIVDDHALVRAGLRSLLERMTGVVVVAEAGDGREALRLARDIKPDVVLMDIAMPDLNGLDATARLVKETPEAAVVILSMHATKAYVVAALRAGASGYVLKNAPVEEMERAIRAVARGEKYLTPAISTQVIESLKTTGAKGEQATQAPESPLTSRQREILQLIAEGRGTREIAERLHLSVKTVETHRAHLMTRLQVRDTAGLVRAAIRLGLVALDT